MSNIVDDLLQDVEQLEASTQQMNDNVQHVEQQKTTLNDSAQAAQNSISLETAKTTQEAAKQSHLAATTSIKLAEQLKARNTELEELSNNWRQAVRNTLREQQTAKKYFSVMMGATLAISIISLSSIGYFFYLLNQQNTQHKGEVLDIIQTESKLLSNKLIVKTDELSSLTEAMSADIKRLSSLNQNGLNASNSIPTSTKVPVIQDKQENVAYKNRDKDNHNASSALNIKQLNTQYAELKTLIKEALATQQSIKNSPATKQNTNTENPVYLKKLNDLSWLIRKQEKALQSIQKTLSGKQSTSSNNKQLQKTLETLKIELSALNQQQTAIQNQIKTLQKSFSKHIQKPAEKPPYSYKSTKEYKLE